MIRPPAGTEFSDQLAPGTAAIGEGLANRHVKIFMKPSEIEELHIWERESKRRLLKLEAEQQAAADADKKRLKEQHWMHCPKCGQPLATEHYGTVEIDLCPSCRGIWLDANELESIVASETGVLRSCLKLLRRSRD